jgi:hypothetical protein
MDNVGGSTHDVVALEFDKQKGRRGGMAGAGTSVEASAVEAAYEAQVQTLFKQLATGLGDLGGTPQAEKESLKRFTVGLAHAKRAKELALGVVGNVTPAAPPLSKKQKKQR